MPSYGFSVGQRFMLHDLEYIIKSIEDQSIEVKNSSYDKIQIIQKTVLEKEWAKGKLSFRQELSSISKERSPTLDLSVLSEAERQETWRRYRILEPVIKGKIPPGKIDNYIDNLSVNERIVRSTFYEWKSLWDRYQDVRYLVPLKRGPKKRRTDERIIEMSRTIINKLLYSGEKTTDEEMYSELILRIDEYNEFRERDQWIISCSKRTFSRIRKELEDVHKLNKNKYGTQLANLMKNGSTAEVFVTRPLERVELDWTPADVMLIHPRLLKPCRPFIVGAIDVFSGYTIGFHVCFEEPNVQNIKQCLLSCIMPKHYIRDIFSSVTNDWIAYGIPETLVVDNAKVNESKDLKEVCDTLGISLEYCTVASGHEKGTIERALQTINQKLLHRLRGTTFSNTKERGRYKSEEKACISLQAFTEMLHITVVDLMANSYDVKRLGTNHEVWEAGIKSNPEVLNRMSRDKAELEILLIGGFTTRTITNKGIALKYENYNSPDLMKLKHKLMAVGTPKHKVKVRYNLDDTRFVYVYDKFYQRWIVAESNGLERWKKHGLNIDMPISYDDLSLFATQKSEGIRKFNVRSVGKAYRVIRSIQNQELKNHRKLKKELEKVQQGRIEETPLTNYYAFSHNYLSKTFLDLPATTDEIHILGDYDQNGNVLTEEEIKEVSSERKVDLNESPHTSYDITLDELEDYDV
ncbi:Mu transposase C-terminal domain-containing protein [Brevibacillus laterosporus]|uniref:Mu transposase C-terminal domain-containing protein n=1 Tax=Brevibacillus laterosporus TaxID=1465 RepID=UPI000839BFDD|nr:Mu transposase C-terminal domain-containing protein [Brevibacillus laterosporus]